jgi:phage replication-related protein YjqB (UPF0714/DUF867 family)
MAPHGGWIEPFTAELAGLVAGNDLSYYAFQGLKEKGNAALHLTSHRFDEPLALRAASSAHWIVALHGERSRHECFVMVGGLWEPFRLRIVAALVQSGFGVREPRPGLEGADPMNICNRGQAGVGGQLEISEALRDRLREDPESLLRFTTAVRGVLFETEAEMNGDGPQVGGRRGP